MSAVPAVSFRSGPTWDEDDLHRAWGAMARARHVLIPTHINTDGDSVSSVLTMAAVVRVANPAARVSCVVSDGNLPPALDWVPGAETLLRYTGEPLPLDDVDLVICVDMPEARRFGPLYEAYRDLIARTPVLLIDHHVPRGEEPALARFIDTSAIAVQSLVHRLIGQWGVAITPQIATLLLIGLVTDSGSFQRVEGNGAPTFRIVADLCDAGGDIALVMDGTRRRKTPGMVAAWGAIINRARWEGPVLWTELTPEMLAGTGADETDGEGVVNWLVGTRGVGAAAIFYRKEGGWRAGLRSTTSAVDVSAFARRYGGGGHVQASGCTFAGGEAERDAFLVALVEYTMEGLRRQPAPDGAS